jgi:hypothetical protein
MSINSNAILAHHHNSCGDQTYYQEYGVNSIITCVFCMMFTTENMELIESNTAVTFLSILDNMAFL